MATQTIEEKAKAEYKSANAAGKKLLERIHGTELFAGKIQDRIKTFGDAYKEFYKMKFKDDTYKKLQQRKVADLTAGDMLLIIARVLQGDWKADWTDSNQYKYYPWFEYNKTKSGFGFSLTNYDYASTCTRVGSRLCFPTEELAKYFGTQFIDLHNLFLTIKQ